MEIIQLRQIALIYLQLWVDRSEFLLVDKKLGSVGALRWNSHINYECAAHPWADEGALSPHGGHDGHGHGHGHGGHIHGHGG